MIKTKNPPVVRMLVTRNGKVAHCPCGDLIPDHDGRCDGKIAYADAKHKTLICLNCGHLFALREILDNRSVRWR